MNSQTPIQTRAHQRPWLARRGFAAGSLLAAIAVGWVLVPPARVLDLLLVVGFCLALAALLAATLARQAVELGALPRLAAAAALLYAALAVGAARSMFRTGQAGTVLDILSAPMGSLPSAWQWMLLTTTALIVTCLVLRAAGRVRRRALEYAGRDALVRRAGIAAERQLGTLTEPQARHHRQDLLREVRFYRDLAGVTQVLGGYAVVVLVVVIVALLAPGRPAPWATDARGVATASAPVSGLAILVFGAEVLVAFSAAASLNKSSLARRAKAAMTRPAAQRLTVVSPEDGREETVELLNPDFVTVSRAQTFAGEPQEVIATFEPEQTGDAEQPRSDGRAESYATIQEYYRAVVERIETLGRGCAILLVGRDRAALPVTVAVNVALQLARRGHRVLLVDADPQRGALAEVFDAEDGPRADAVGPTCIEGIGLWMGDRAALFEAGGLVRVCSRLNDRADCVLAYVPCLDHVTGPAEPPAGSLHALLFQQAAGQPSPDEVKTRLGVGVEAAFPSPGQAVTS